MNNVVYRDDKEYPELLRQMGKDAPKQLYFKGNWSLVSSDHSESPLCHSEAKPKNLRSFANAQDDNKNAQKIQNARSDRSSSVLQKVNFPEPSIFENCLAVVGSRKLTSYGKQVMERLVGEIALAGITIVSGFMYGGDAIAHEAVVKAGGRTIAVMPCGINKIHPEYQEDLYNEILENNGLIISEYEGDIGPALWTYPQRNRIVAGLSKALLVVEAGEKSGCLITANCAKKFDRKIFAVPGPITSSVSKGSNVLIKEGAEMVLSAKDVLEYYRSLDSYSKISERFIPLKREPYTHQKFQNMNLSNSRSDASQKIQNTRSDHSEARPPCHSEGFSPKNLRSFANAQDDNKNAQDDNKNAQDDKGFESQILELLDREPMGVDEMSRNLGVSVSELGVKLSMIEIKGLIKLRGNKYGIN